ncbi:hypothetical protein [Gordonia neofelifaecis]|uniref:Low molecular weight antigen MTB12-like C-terminal domain-containing protein n=1 Tax=Gordonia neofelifaecis NRRL B-59395 TaxID=644548 RepID=F1YJ82_9ACTN|nr:hypothetical protein [Gordonia neofelifaecis]EGD55115.1 hypothetical protein SCNU_09594 [Gordonia neofelifaecis NRRL B-59395]
MTVSRNLRRPAAAVAALAAATALLAACSSSDDDSASATSASAPASASATVAVAGLDNGQAQVIVRKAVDGDTTVAELSTVLDTSTPGAAEALNAFSKAANEAGYTPDAYTVKSVKADGENKAVAVTAIKSPHAPEPVDLNLAMVKQDGEWKLAGASVTTLTSMMPQH